MYDHGGPPKLLGEQRKNGIISGEQRPNIEGNRGTKDNIGEQGTKETFFIFVEQENTPIYFRGTREHVPHWDGLRSAG